MFILTFFFVRKGYLACFIAVVFLASCEKDITQPIDVIPNRGVLNPECEAYNTQNIGFDAATIMMKFGRYIVTGGTNDIRVIEAESFRVINSYSEIQLQVKDFTEVNGRLYVCGIKGIFVVESNGTISKVSNEPCSDLLYDVDKLLFVSTVGQLGPNNRAAANVKVLDQASFQFSFYTDSNYVEENHFPRRMVMFQDELFLLTSLDNENRIVQLNNREVERFYDIPNILNLAGINFWLPPSNTEMFVWKEQLWLFTYNGPRKILLRLRNGTFELVKFWQIEDLEMSDEDITFALAHVNRIQLCGDDFCVNTGEGLALLSLGDGGEEVGLAFVTDPLLPSNNWVHFVEESTTITYVLSNHEFLTKVVCR